MPKLRELKALNISARNWIRTFSDKRVFLMIPKSTWLRPSDRRIFRSAFPTSCPGLVLMERKLIHKVPGQPVRAVIPRTGAVSATIEGILRAGKFRRRRRNGIGNIVYELAPGVMQAGTEITTQALCQTCLKSV